MLLAVASMAAVWWPTRRATKIDPMRALHYE
jgi:ABC-type antimicrobial peptide transport system permease subunit